MSQLANALIEYETLNSDEVKLVLKGEPLNRAPILGDALIGEEEKKGNTGEIVEGI